MQVEAELARVAPSRETLLGIGVFDGIHLGHQHLLAKLVRQAREAGLLAGVVTFQRHPEEVIRGIRLPFLTDAEERRRLLKEQGIDLVITLSFDRDLASLSAREFIRLLQKHLRMRGLVIGPDFALGKDRQGNTAQLLAMGQEMGFSVTVVPPLTLNGEVVSSTAIRRAIAAGDMAKARRYTGRYFRLSGRVVSGAGRGATLGFPTANLDIRPEQVLPADGVYAGRAYVNGNTYLAVTNIGTCPTFGDCPRTAEAFLIDFHGDLYGRGLEVEFVQRLRGEAKFTSPQALSRQVAEDIRQGKAIMAKSSVEERR